MLHFHCWHEIPDSRRKLPLKPRDRPRCLQKPFEEIDLYRRVSRMFSEFKYSTRMKCCLCGKEKKEIVPIFDLQDLDDSREKYMAYPTGDEY